MKNFLSAFLLIGSLGATAQAETYLCATPVDALGRAVSGKYKLITDADSGVTLVTQYPGAPQPVVLPLLKQSTSSVGDLTFSAKTARAKLHNYYEDGQVKVSVTLQVYWDGTLYASTCK